jgi:hypothetical protein
MIQRPAERPNIDSKSSKTIMAKRKVLWRASERRKMTRQREGISHIRTRRGSDQAGRGEADIYKVWQERYRRILES